LLSALSPAARSQLLVDAGPAIEVAMGATGSSGNNRGLIADAILAQLQKSDPNAYAELVARARRQAMVRSAF